MQLQKIAPCLWFDDQAEEAANFYTSLFEDSKVMDLSRYGEGGPGKPGSVMTVNFRLAGQNFIALNGGPAFQFNEAISFSVSCESQEEVDELWTKLTADGGEEGNCAWLKDKFGVSWQIVPTVLIEMLNDPDREKANRVMRSMLTMKKIDVPELKRAYDGV